MASSGRIVLDDTIIIFSASFLFFPYVRKSRVTIDVFSIKKVEERAEEESIRYPNVMLDFRFRSLISNKNRFY